MSMSFRMTLSQKLETKLELDQKLVLSMKCGLKLALKISQLLRDIRKEYDPDDKRVKSSLDETFKLMAQVLDAEQIGLMRESLRALVFQREEMFLEKVLENSAALLFEGKNGVRKLAGRLLAAKVKMTGDMDVGDITEGQIANELIDPQDTQKRIDEMNELIKALGINKGTEIALKNLHEAKSLKAFGDQLRPHYNEVVEFFDTLLGFPSIAENPLRRVLVDFYMLDQAGLLVSERLVKRFAAVFSRRRGDLTEEKLEVGVANIIGEFILVGMGVIDPEIFKLMTGKATYKEDDEMVLDNGKRAEIGELTQKYNLKNGRFFYNSYATLKIKPGLKSDELIRNFLIHDIRAVRKDLCAAVDLRGLIDSFCSDLDNHGNTEARDSLMRNIETSLDADVFRQTVTEIIKSKLLPKLVQTATGNKSQLP